MHPHTEALTDRHHSLDEKIAREQARAGSSDEDVSQMKKAKLALKDELTRSPD